MRRFWKRWRRSLLHPSLWSPHPTPRSLPRWGRCLCYGLPLGGFLEWDYQGPCSSEFYWWILDFTELMMIFGHLRKHDLSNHFFPIWQILLLCSWNDASLHPPQTFSWASVTSKNLPPSGTVPTSGISPHVVKAPSSQVTTPGLEYHGNLRKISYAIVNNQWTNWVTLQEYSVFNSLSDILSFALDLRWWAVIWRCLGWAGYLQ